MENEANITTEHIDMFGNNTIVIICAVQTIISIIAVTMHVIGIYLLRTTPSYIPSQKLYLTQLSILEIMFMIINNNLLLYLLLTGVSPALSKYLPLLVLCTIAIPWSNVMVLLTLDRFAQIHLNIRYKAIVTPTKTRCFVTASWLIGITFFAVMFPLQYVYGINSYLYMHKYVTQIFMGMVMLVSIPTYIYIYYKIKTNKMKNRHTHIRKKATFVPFWIVISFFWLFVFPNLIQLGVYHEDSMKGTYAYIIAIIIFNCGCLVDAVIYSTMNPSLKKKLVMLLCCRLTKGRGKTQALMTANGTELRSYSPTPKSSPHLVR